MSTTNKTMYPAHVAATLTTAQQAKNITLGALNSYDAKLKDWVEDLVLTLPEEQFLDQAQTKFYESFAYSTWSATVPSGSSAPTDPSLDGKPVLVLALKAKGTGTDGAFVDTYTYQFVDMTKLVDVYIGKDDIKGVKVVVADGTDENAGKKVISAELKLHEAEEGEATNLAQISDDGKLYVPTPAAFDASGLTSRISALETTVGQEADGEDPATGLIKSVADLNTTISGINTTIGTKADGENAATGIYKDIEDAIADAALTDADDDDIDALF